MHSFRMFSLFHCLAVAYCVLRLSSSCISALPSYCLPSNTTCWPTAAEISSLAAQLDGALVTQESNANVYVELITGNNLVWTQYPPWIIVCASAADIQSGVTFSREHRLQISISSTGHSYAGRNSANNSLMINLSQMQRYRFSGVDNSAITVETGLRWGQIYAAVDAVGKMIVGGADPSVGPGGYALGGGHSPLTASLGLSCDWITSVYMVDANSAVVHVRNTSGADARMDELFWSLKGGGGSTFGVVINITFTLHAWQPSATNTVNAFECVWASEVAVRAVTNHIFAYMQSGALAADCGGYLVMDAHTIFVAMMIPGGDYQAAKANLAPIVNFMPEAQLNRVMNCSVRAFDSFWELWQTVGAAGYARQYDFNALVPRSNLTEQYTEQIMEYMSNAGAEWHLQGIYVGCTATIIQGKSAGADASSSAVSPGLRHSFLSMGCPVRWPNATQDDMVIQYAERYEEKLRTFGVNIYSNEEDRGCPDCDWQTEFWGKDNYERLLKAKQDWDPNNVFYCYHCVGDEDD